MSRRPDASEFVAKILEFEPQGVTRALDHGPIGGRVAAHEHGDAYHAIATNDGDFGGGAVLHGIEQRNDCDRRQVDV
jgi:hypothetical protein